MRDEDRQEPGIQLAPLVDIVFLLLVFFLVATTYLDDLYRELVEARRANPAVPVILRGDRSASHGQIVGVLSICRRARIRNVAVAVQPERDSGTADERK